MSPKSGSDISGYHSSYAKSVHDEKHSDVNIDEDHSVCQSVQIRNTFIEQLHAEKEEEEEKSTSLGHTHQLGPFCSDPYVQNIPIYKLPCSLHDRFYGSPESIAPCSDMYVMNSLVRDPIPVVHTENAEVNAPPTHYIQLGVRNSAHTSSKESSHQVSINESSDVRAERSPPSHSVRSSISGHCQISTPIVQPHVDGSTNPNNDDSLVGVSLRSERNTISYFKSSGNQNRLRTSVTQNQDGQDPYTGDGTYCGSTSKRAISSKNVVNEDAYCVLCNRVCQDCRDKHA